jgi:hypothetical protein
VAVTERDVLLLAAFICTVLYFVVPEDATFAESGSQAGWFMSSRLSWFPIILSLAWIASRVPVKIQNRLGTTLVLPALALNIASLHYGIHCENVRLDGYLAGTMHVRQDDAVIGLNLAPPPSDAQCLFMVHAVDRYCVSRNAFDVANYETRLWHFPVKVRDDMRSFLPNPFTVDYHAYEYQPLAYTGVVDCIVAYVEGDPAVVNGFARRYSRSYTVSYRNDYVAVLRRRASSTPRSNSRP